MSPHLLRAPGHLQDPFPTSQKCTYMHRGQGGGGGGRPNIERRQCEIHPAMKVPLEKEKQTNYTNTRNWIFHMS